MGLKKRSDDLLIFGGANERDAEELFLSHAIMDLKRGHTTYVYRDYILESLKQMFKKLDIKRKDFYWEVRNKEVSK